MLSKKHCDGSGWWHCRKQPCISKVADYMDYSIFSISDFYESMIVLFPLFCTKGVIKWLLLKCSWKGRSGACLEMNAVSVQVSYAEIIGKWRNCWAIPPERPNSSSAWLVVSRGRRHLKLSHLTWQSTRSSIKHLLGFCLHEKSRKCPLTRKRLLRVPTLN